MTTEPPVPDDPSDAGIDAMPGDDLAPRRVVVPLEHEGGRLDQVLAALLPDCSRSQLQRLIKSGHVLDRHGEPVARSSEPVAAGDTFDVDAPPPAPSRAEPQPIPLDIVFEDADLIVINKAAGMVVHPAAGHADGTLVNALLHHVEDLDDVGDEARPGIVHRLDRGTSGLMVVAKTERAHAELARQFHDREVTKEYVALVWGVVVAGRRIEEPIGRDPVNRLKMSTRARRSRAATTRVIRAESLPGLTLRPARHRHRAHAPDSRAPCGHRPSHRRGRAVRRRAAARAPASEGRHAARAAVPARGTTGVLPPDRRPPLEFTTSLPDDLQSVLDELHEARERFKV